MTVTRAIRSAIQACAECARRARAGGSLSLPPWRRQFMRAAPMNNGKKPVMVPRYRAEMRNLCQGSVI